MTTASLLVQTILAQAAPAQASQGPSLPGAPAAAPAAAAGDAAASGAAATQAAPAGPGFMIMMVVLLGAMILFSFVSARREKKKRAELLDNIKKHDKVLTIGGVVGTVVEMKDDAVVLKVDEDSNTRITFTKTAISQVIQQGAKA